MYTDDNIQTPVPSSIDADTRVHSHPITLADYDEAVCMIDTDAGTLVEPVVIEPVPVHGLCAPQKLVEAPPQMAAVAICASALDIEDVWKVRALVLDPAMDGYAVTDEVLDTAHAAFLGSPGITAGYLTCITDPALRYVLIGGLMRLVRADSDAAAWDALLDAKNEPLLTEDEAADLRARMDEEVEEWARELFAEADELRRAGASTGGPEAYQAQRAWEAGAEALRAVIGGPDWGAQARHADALREALADDDETEDDMSKPEGQAAPAATARPLVPEGQPTPRDIPPWTPLPMPAAGTTESASTQEGAVTDTSTVVAGPWTGSTVPAGTAASAATGGDPLAALDAEMETDAALWIDPGPHPDDAPYTEAEAAAELDATEQAYVRGTPIPRKAWRAVASALGRKEIRKRWREIEKRQGGAYVGEEYPDGFPGDVALLRAICDHSDRTRAVFHAARDTKVGNPVILILLSLIRTGLAAPTDLGPYEGVPLSTFVDVIGKSGAGKGESTDAKKLPWGEDVQRIAWQGRGWAPPKIEEKELASGQVVPHMYLNKTDLGYVKKSHPALFLMVDEMMKLISTSAGSSNTIMPTLTSMWSMKGIGEESITHGDTRVHGDYTAFMIAGIQELMSLGFLDTVAIGLAQRFIHTCPYDPYRHVLAPVIKDTRRPDGTYPAPPDVIVPPNGLTLCDEISVAFARNAVRASISTEQDDDDAAHSTMARVRLACLFALWHGRTEVTTDDWAWSGAVMEYSRRSWSHLKAVAEIQKQSKAHEVGTTKGWEDDARNVVKNSAYQDRYNAVAKKVKAAGKQGVLVSQLLNGMSKSKGQRQLISAQLGQIVSEMTAGPTACARLEGKRVVWGKSTSAKTS